MESRNKEIKEYVKVKTNDRKKEVAQSNKLDEQATTDGGFEIENLNILLWIIPALFILVALAVIVMVFLKKNREIQAMYEDSLLNRNQTETNDVLELTTDMIATPLDADKIKKKVKKKSNKK